MHEGGIKHRKRMAASERRGNKSTLLTTHKLPQPGWFALWLRYGVAITMSLPSEKYPFKPHD